MNAKTLLAGAFAGILANVSGYFITGRWFHRFQSATPHTWRSSESWVHYLYATLARLVACMGIAAVCALTTHSGFWIAGSAVLRGVGLGSALWLVTAAPVILETSVFVNWHRGFVVGLLLDWWMVFVLAGVAGAFAMDAT